MWSMIWPILIVVGANTFYHICAKSTPENANAFASLAITYGVGAVLSIVMFYLTGARGLAGELGKTNWTAWVLGIAVVGLEFGNICLYRAGWKVSVGSLIGKHHACLRTACRGPAALSRDHHAASGPRRSRLPCGHLSRGRVTRDARNYIRKGRRKPSFFTLIWIPSASRRARDRGCAW